MVSNNLNRLFIGSILILVVLLFYFINFDLLFILILLSFISYDLFHIKTTSNYFIISFLIISIFSFFFISFILFKYLFIFQFVIILFILVSKKFKDLLFTLSLYLFCINLFYIVNIDRNIFYLIILTSFFNDTIAYIVGRLIKGPLILPNISPKKTWSGTSISFIATTLLLILFNFNFLISMIISLFLFIGDIFFSYIKRYLNIKDFSLLLGSHGGILDRLDSMFFVAIIFHIYLVYLT